MCLRMVAPSLVMTTSPCAVWICAYGSMPRGGGVSEGCRPTSTFDVSSSRGRDEISELKTYHLVHSLGPERRSHSVRDRLGSCHV